MFFMAKDESLPLEHNWAWTCFSVNIQYMHSKTQHNRHDKGQIGSWFFMMAKLYPTKVHEINRPNRGGDEVQFPSINKWWWELCTCLPLIENQDPIIYNVICFYILFCYLSLNVLFNIYIYIILKHF